MDNVQQMEKPIIKTLYSNDLKLSLTNPRFPSSVESQEEAILSFFELKKVGPKKIMSIIEDIFHTRNILEDFIALKENNNYIVYDGNRRLTAIKLFENNNVDLIKEKYKRVYNLVIELKKEFDISKIPLLVKVYSDKDSMANHVLRRHSGEQLGIGQISWSSNEIDTFASQHLNRPRSLGNEIYKKLENSIKHQKLYNKIKDGAYTTTFDRIFTFLDIRSRIFNLKYGEHVDIDNHNHFKKICEMIEFFIDNDGNVGDVYTKDNAVSFFATIEPIEKKYKKPKDKNGTLVPPKNPKVDQNSKIINVIDTTTGDTVIPKDEDTSIIHHRIDNRGRPRKRPKDYDKLLKAYPFKNTYRKNLRINNLLNELNDIHYKDFGLATNFLIRSLLETYAFEYTKTFNGIHRKNTNRLSGLTIKNFSDKDLNEKYYNHIANHIGTLENGKYSTIKNQIINYFNKNNNVSITQKLNNYVHNPDFQPSYIENLQTWETVHTILLAIDGLLNKYSGQSE